MSEWLSNMKVIRHQIGSRGRLEIRHDIIPGNATKNGTRSKGQVHQSREAQSSTWLSSKDSILLKLMMMDEVLSNGILRFNTTTTTNSLTKHGLMERNSMNQRIGIQCKRLFDTWTRYSNRMTSWHIQHNLTLRRTLRRARLKNIFHIVVHTIEPQGSSLTSLNDVAEILERS